MQKLYNNWMSLTLIILLSLLVWIFILDLKYNKPLNIKRNCTGFMKTIKLERTFLFCN